MGGNKSQGKHFASAASQLGLLGGQYGRQLYEQTEPFRGGFYQTWEDMMGGNLPGGAFPQMYQAAKVPIESQYTAARRNVLEQIPRGGQLTEALTDVELGRSQGLQNVLANLYSGELSRMYEQAFGIPSMALQAMLGLSQQGVQTQTGMAQACCFNFLEAEGEIYHTVRRYRDEYYAKDGLVGKGYRLTASWFVPLMREYPNFKKLIRLTMTKPIKTYTQWYYGENRYGFIFESIAKGWANLWRFLGLCGGYRY